MAKLTPEELQAARQRKAEERVTEQEQMRARQERERQAADEQLERDKQALEERQGELERREQGVAEQSAEVAQLRAHLARVESATQALYTEIDKLAKKSPRDPVTQLMVNSTNRAIEGLKTLLGDRKDEFSEQIVPLIPAGDLPETRDVLVILGQMRAALTRFKNEVEGMTKDVSHQQARLEHDKESLKSERLRLTGEDDDDDDDDDEGEGNDLDDELDRVLRRPKRPSRYY